METAIGVFTSRDHAEEAVKELRDRGVPEESIVFLSRSESDAKAVAKQLGEYVGGFIGGAAGMSAGVVAASLLLPGIGIVFAFGIGGAALLGITGAGLGASVSDAAHDKSHDLAPTPDEKCSEDVRFFREVLRAGRSLIVVRTKSSEIAAHACSVLDRHGMNVEGKAPGKLQASTRVEGKVFVVDLAGRITVGEGNVILRKFVTDALQNGHRKILLNLEKLQYVDSSGLGELVRTHTTVRRHDGLLMLSNVNKRVHDLLHITRLAVVFDIWPNESAALDAFNSSSSSAVA